MTYVIILRLATRCFTRQLHTQTNIICLLFHGTPVQVRCHGQESITWTCPATYFRQFFHERAIHVVARLLYCGGTEGKRSSINAGLSKYSCIDHESQQAHRGRRGKGRVSRAPTLIKFEEGGRLFRFGEGRMRGPPFVFTVEDARRRRNPFSSSFGEGRTREAPFVFGLREELPGRLNVRQSLLFPPSNTTPSTINVNSNPSLSTTAANDTASPSGTRISPRGCGTARKTITSTTDKQGLSQATPATLLSVFPRGMATGPGSPYSNSHKAIEIRPTRLERASADIKPSVENAPASKPLHASQDEISKVIPAEIVTASDTPHTSLAATIKDYFWRVGSAFTSTKGPQPAANASARSDKYERVHKYEWWRKDGQYTRLVCPLPPRKKVQVVL